ncbi:MAG: hypothetical protein LBI87_09450, partial [Candidatus Accumulibacter sp.]|nr:hypothetical protein [Accumulibacter sp.]
RRRTKRLDRFPPGLEAPAIAAVETLIGPGMASRIAVTGTGFEQPGKLVLRVFINAQSRELDVTLINDTMLIADIPQAVRLPCFSMMARRISQG